MRRFSTFVCLRILRCAVQRTHAGSVNSLTHDHDFLPREERKSPHLLRWIMASLMAAGLCVFHAITPDPLISLASANIGAGHPVAGAWRASPAIKQKPRIVLDAGHGGSDFGSAGANGVLEKDLSLDLARRVARLLRADGRYEVIFTRAADNYVPLAWRVETANVLGADVFVSIHANASRSPLAAGPETYYSASFASDRARVQGAVPSDKLNLPDIRERTSRSCGLAALVQQQLSTVVGALRDRGVHRAGFAVLEGVTMPAVLVEVGFLTNLREARDLEARSTRESIAMAAAAGILGYEQECGSQGSGRSCEALQRSFSAAPVPE